MSISTPWNTTNGHHSAVSDKLEDVRNVLGREADHLAQVASQIGRDAGAQADATARDIARDAQKQTNAAMSRIADVAAALGPTIVAMGRQRAKQVGDQAQSLGHELGKVRITTEPKKNDAAPSIALLGGLGIGLGVGIVTMWLLDPERGRQRRAALKARFAEWTRERREAAAGAISNVRESVGTGIGTQDDYIDEPVVPEAQSYETWPEGTRVPIT